MRQRVMIAMALINDPKLLIADEPTTALDVTVQAQILELIERLQRELDTAIVMITHDLGVVAEVADDIAVMYAGRHRRVGADKEAIFAAPEHPYTWGLLKSIPRLDSPRDEPLVPIPGRPPSLINKPPRLRVPSALPLRARGAQAHRPAARRRAEATPAHRVACLLPAETRARRCGRAAGGRRRRPSEARAAGGARTAPTGADGSDATPASDAAHRGPRPRQALPADEGHHLPEAGRRRPRRRRRQLRRHRGRDARARGRVGLRQVHDRAR